MRNRLSTRTLSKEYFYVLDHIEYIISTFLRFVPVIFLTVEMLAFFFLRYECHGILETVAMGMA
jgi:hypothetical protein